MLIFVASETARGVKKSFMRMKKVGRTDRKEEERPMVRF